jgi:hypothetical protein
MGLSPLARGGSVNRNPAHSQGCSKIRKLHALCCGGSCGLVGGLFTNSVLLCVRALFQLRLLNTVLSYNARAVRA